MKFAPQFELNFALDAQTSDALIDSASRRMTVDRNIHVTGPASELAAGLAAHFVQMNFSVSLPSIFKELIYEFALLPEQPTLLFELAKEAALQANSSRLKNFLPVAIEAQGLGDSRYVDEVATCQLG